MIVQDIDLRIAAKEHATVMVAQPSSLQSDWAQKDYRLGWCEERRAQERLTVFLDKARQTRCDLLLMPELSVPKSLVGIVSGWSAQTGCLVVAGTHYAETEAGFVARCPVVFGGREYNVEKVNPAPAEVSPIPGHGIVPTATLTRFTNTPVGSLGVLICSDYLADPVKAALELSKLDVLSVPAFQRDSTRYHKRMDIDVETSDSGLYILYSNSIVPGIADGRSAAFAIVDTLWTKELEGDSGVAQSMPTRAVMLNSDEDFFVVRLDIRRKRPSRPRTVMARPTVSLVERGALFSGQIHIGGIQEEPAVPAPSTDAETEVVRSHEILAEVKKLIARHGLDDQNWTTAFSAILFLAQLAEHLRREHRADYNALVDKFLTYFQFRSDDTIALREDQILVTPDENARMCAAMEEEDRSDPFFAQTPKTRAGNVDMQVMHENYLYSVALGVCAKSKSRVLSTIRDTALSHLVHDTANRSRDPGGGGWTPYRVPWITARVITSISRVDLDGRPDATPIRAAMSLGLESLVHRLDPTGFWRSGVGAWVSKWECTALCLESFLCADLTGVYKPLVAAVVEHALEAKDDWLTATPRFDSEDHANDTLAGVLMASVVLRLHRNYLDDAQVLSSERALTLLEFLLLTLRSVPPPLEIHQRQFCTIPQVAAYSAAVCRS